jgi:hypothetical protein
MCGGAGACAISSLENDPAIKTTANQKNLTTRTAAVFISLSSGLRRRKPHFFRVDNPFKNDPPSTLGSAPPHVKRSTSPARQTTL